jgi:hypothetical protein
MSMGNIMKRSEYEIELYYGYEESTYGIYHAFEAVGKDDEVDSDKMAKGLAMMLDCIDVNDDDEEEISDRFNCNSMFIALPESTVAQIKADAIKEYLENLK